MTTEIGFIAYAKLIATETKSQAVDWWIFTQERSNWTKPWSNPNFRKVQFLAVMGEPLGPGDGSGKHYWWCEILEQPRWIPTQPDLTKKLMDEWISVGGIFILLWRLCSRFFPWKCQRSLVSTEAQSATPRVAQMKEPAMCNGCVWHCTEPQGPGVNITWQCEKNWAKKGSFDPLFISPLSATWLCRV